MRYDCVLRFAWQAQYFQGVSQFASRFFVAGAALCGAASSIFGAGAALFDVVLSRIAVSVKAAHTLKVVAAAAFCDCPEASQRSYFLSFVKNILIRLTRRKSLIFSFNVSGSLAQKPSFWRFKLSSWEVILAFCVARTIF